MSLIYAQPLVQPIDELAQLQDRTAVEITKRLEDLAREVVRLRLGEGSRIALDAAAEAFGARVQQLQLIADVLGRRRAQLEFKAQNLPPEFFSECAEKTLAWRHYVGGALHFAASLSPRSVPELLQGTFDEAVIELFKRLPTPIEKGTQDEIRAAYLDPVGRFALARSASQEITAQVQDLLVASLAKGEPLDTFVKAFEALEQTGFTRQYAQVVHRNATNTAFSAGRFKQAASSPIIAGLEFVATGTPEATNTRPNHWAADGMIARVDDDVWEVLSPPLGHQCRCAVRLVTKLEARRRGLLTDQGLLPLITTLPSKNGVTAGPDPGTGFGRRPDRAIYRT